MDVTVKFHLSARLTGTEEDELTIVLQEGVSIDELYRLLGRRYPVFAENFLSARERKNRKIPLLAVVNRKSISLNQKIKHGDYVDIFLIAAGG
jgi:molybdopterin converting factor small subunit